MKFETERGKSYLTEGRYRKNKLQDRKTFEAKKNAEEETKGKRKQSKVRRAER